jgi:DNA-directed RNA polymerase specialized sigma24 family protein
MYKCTKFLAIGHIGFKESEDILTDLSTRSVWVRLAAPHLYSCDLDELRALIQNGEQKAACALYDRYKRPLVRFAYYLSENEKKAQKLVQQAFLDLFLAIKNKQTEIDLVAWSYRHMVRAYLTEFSHTSLSSELNQKKRAFGLTESEMEDLALRPSSHLLAVLSEMAPLSRAKFLLWILSELKVDQQAWVFDLSTSQWKAEWERASLEALDWSQVIQQDKEEEDGSFN